MREISENVGWGPACWWRKSNSDGFKDTNKFPSSSENWKRWSHLSRRLSNAGTHRRVGYARGYFPRRVGRFLRLARDSQGRGHRYDSCVPMRDARSVDERDRSCKTGAGVEFQRDDPSDSHVREPAGHGLQLSDPSHGRHLDFSDVGFPVQSADGSVGVYTQMLDVPSERLGAEPANRPEHGH